MTTSSYNPILGREDLPPWWMFWLRPQLKPGVAMVLMQKGLPAKALRENDSAKWSLIAWHNYQTVFWVDVNQQTLAFQCKLPTRTPGIEFQAEVYVTYQVNQPIEIVRRRITDVRTVVEPRLVRLLREASLQYVADQCTAAEKKINEEAERNITNHNLRQGDIAIKGYFVTLDMEEEERTHAQRMRFIDRNNAYAVLNTWYNGHIDLLDAVRARNQINLYKDIIQTGDSNLLLLYLANHREEIQPVLGALNQQRDRERDHWKRMFEILSKADGIEAQHLDDLRSHVLARLTEIEMRIKAVAELASGTGSPGPGMLAGGQATPPTGPAKNGASGPGSGAGQVQPAQGAAAGAGTAPPPAQSAAAGDGQAPPPAQGAPADKGAAPAQSAAAGKGATPAQGAPADKGAAPSAQATPAAPATGPTISEPVVPVEIADDPPDIAQTPPP